MKKQHLGVHSSIADTENRNTDVAGTTERLARELRGTGERELGASHRVQDSQRQHVCSLARGLPEPTACLTAILRERVNLSIYFFD